MKVCENGTYRELTPEEISAMEAERIRAEQEYWVNVPYEEAVNTEIRKKYSESQEFAVLRQKDDKPEEYAAYYAYCEGCKAFVKNKKATFC